MTDSFESKQTDGSSAGIIIRVPYELVPGTPKKRFLQPSESIQYGTVQHASERRMRECTKCRKETPLCCASIIEVRRETRQDPDSLVPA